MAVSKSGEALGASNHFDPVCITCSDQGVRARIIEFLDDARARVETGSAVEEVSVDLVDAARGDIVLVHAGVAIGKVSYSTLNNNTPPQPTDIHGAIPR